MLDAKDVMELVRTKWNITPKVYKENIDNGSYGVIAEGNSVTKTFVPAISKDMMSSFGLDYIGSSTNFKVQFTYEGDLTPTDIITITGNFAVVTHLNLYTYMSSTKLLKDFIVTGLTGNNATISGVSLITTNGDCYLSVDEYNPLAPAYQIIFINRPERTMFVAPNVIKHEQDINVEIHVKLVRYAATEVTTKRATFLAMKGELSRIFNTFRYDNVGTTLNVSAWIDSKLPHGYGIQTDPLELITRLTMQIFYYEATGSEAIGVRVSRVNILGSDLLGLIDADHIDTNPWVHLQVPKGPLLEQHLLGPHYDITIRTHDYASLHTLFYETLIEVGGNQYPVLVNGTKIRFSRDIPLNPQFIIYMKDDSGNELRYNFYDVRVKQIELERTNTSGQNEAIWKITLMADYMYYGIPE